MAHYLTLPEYEHLQVILNGIAQPLAVEADEEAGWVRTMIAIREPVRHEIIGFQRFAGEGSPPAIVRKHVVKIVPIKRPIPLAPRWQHSYVAAYIHFPP